MEKDQTRGAGEMPAVLKWLEQHRPPPWAGRRASASKSDDTTKPYYNDLVAQQCWVENGQAYVQNNTRGKDCPPHCPPGIPIPGATKCPNPLANLPELPKPHCRSLSASFGRVSLLGFWKA